MTGFLEQPRNYRKKAQVTLVGNQFYSSGKEMISSIALTLHFWWRERSRILRRKLELTITRRRPWKGGRKLKDCLHRVWGRGVNYLQSTESFQLQLITNCCRCNEYHSDKLLKMHNKKIWKETEKMHVETAPCVNRFLRQSNQWSLRQEQWPKLQNRVRFVIAGNKCIPPTNSSSLDLKLGRVAT